MKTHKDLDVWKKSIDLVAYIYELTSKFPKSEQFGLSDQMRRAAISIPSNIAEGAARQSEREFCQFLHIALGSLAELETQAIIAQRLGYFVAGYEDFDTRAQDIGRMISGLIKHLKNRDS